MHLLVVNARHMRNVPGKKTDMRDAEWIASLLRAGLLKGSFVPEQDIRDLRQYTRYRKALIQDITSQKNRVEKLLQASGFRLSSFLSDIFGVSGMGLMQELIQVGYLSQESVKACLKAAARKKADEILSNLKWDRIRSATPTPQDATGAPEGLAGESPGSGRSHPQGLFQV